MKRTYFVLAMLSMAILLGAFTAKTSPAQTPPLVSPDVHADRTVTFRFRAPNDKEVAVSVEGNPKPLPMQKDDQGVWSVTTEPLAPDYYGYSFMQPNEKPALALEWTRFPDSSVLAAI